MTRTGTRNDTAVHRGCPRSIDTAVYLLDGLDPREGEEFARHLDDCPTCQAEVEELASVAHLLAVACRRLRRRGGS